MFPGSPKIKTTKKTFYLLAIGCGANAEVVRAAIAAKRRDKMIENFAMVIGVVF